MLFVLMQPLHPHQAFYFVLFLGAQVAFIDHRQESGAERCSRGSQNWSCTWDYRLCTWFTCSTNSFSTAFQKPGCYSYFARKHVLHCVYMCYKSTAQVESTQVKSCLQKYQEVSRNYICNYRCSNRN